MDSICLETKVKAENKIDLINQFNLEELKKPENTIESNNSLLIKEKEKIPNENQNIDSITIESKEKEENQIQPLHKINLLELNKPENLIQTTEELFIEKMEKNPNEFQLVDNILIEGYSYDDSNLMQKIDEFTVFKNIKLSYRIDKMDSFYIKQKNKGPIKSQTVDSIFITGETIEYEDNNQIQQMDKIIILKQPKEQNKIEKTEDFVILYKSKSVLMIQRLGTLEIEKEPKEIELEFVEVDKIEIPQIEKEINYVESPNEKITIFGKQKDKSQDNLIQVIDKFAISDIPKPISLDIKQAESLLINAKDIPENISQNIDTIQISLDKKFPEDNIKISEGEKIIIKSKEKQELKNENINSILLTGKIKDENSIQIAKVDQINLLELNKPENKIEEIETILIKPKEKEKEELEIQECDIMPIEGLIPPQNEIQKSEFIEILKTEKSFIHEIELIESLYLPPKIKPLLKSANIDNILYQEIPKEENEIQLNERFLLKISPKDIGLNNSIEQNINLYIEPKKQNQIQIPLAYQKVENINIKSDIKEDLPKEKSFNDINIDKILDFHIQSKEKEILEYQIIDRMLIESLSKPENEIQQAPAFTIEKSFKAFDSIIPENEIKLYIEPNVKEPLEKQTIDSLFVEKDKKKEENKIERNEGFNILKKPKEIKPKEKEELKINNFNEIFIQRLKPSFKSLVCSKEFQESFNKLNAEMVKKEPALNNNSIERAEILNIPPIDINEEYILNLINRNNLDKEKFNLHNKNKGKEIVTPSEKDKKEFIKDKMDDLYFSEQPKDKEKRKPFLKLLKRRESEIIINKEVKPILKSPKTISNYIVNHENSVNIKSQELSQDKIYLLFLEKWKSEKLKVQKAAKFELIKEKEKEKPLEKEIKINKIINLSIFKPQTFELKGIKSSEDYKKLMKLDSKDIKEKQQIEPKSVINIFIQQEKKSSSTKKIIKLKSSKPESFKLEGNISQKYYEELLLIKKKFTYKKTQILQIKSSFFSLISKNPKKISSYSEQTSIQKQIKGKQKKPFIIESKSYFIINSKPRPSKNLIVRGSCFGFLASPKKPGLVSQDFGVTQKLKSYSNPNWNLSNKLQRSQYFNINGTNNKIIWNKIIKRQKCVKFNIPPTKMQTIDVLSAEKIDNIIYIPDKSLEQEIIKEDYNFNSIQKDKDEKQKREVRSTISRVIHEPQFEDVQEEFDPFSCCKKRETKKYDKIFNERKTASAMMKENNDINSNIISPAKPRITENLRRKENEEIKFKDKKERKSDLNLFENKNKNKLKLVSKDSMQKNNQIFKKKEKKTEYMRDYGAFNDQNYN